MVEVSKHAVKRIRERLGLPKKAAQAAAEKALKEGIHINETSGRYRAFLDRLHLTRMDGAEYITTPAGIFVVKGDILVTVLPIPKDHASRVIDIWKKRGRT